MKSKREKQMEALKGVRRRIQNHEVNLVRAMMGELPHLNPLVIEQKLKDAREERRRLEEALNL